MTPVQRQLLDEFARREARLLLFGPENPCAKLPDPEPNPHRTPEQLRSWD